MYKRIAFFIITLFFFVIISAVSINAQDAAKVAPNIYKVKFENERVRVLDVQSNPGDKSDWHSHPGGPFYVLEGGKMKMTTKDGSSKINELKKGQTGFEDAVTHKSENVGKTKVHLILVELKK